jgi:hypothetical protein
MCPKVEPLRTDYWNCSMKGCEHACPEHKYGDLRPKPVKPDGETLF